MTLDGCGRFIKVLGMYLCIARRWGLELVGVNGGLSFENGIGTVEPVREFLGRTTPFPSPLGLR